MRFFSHRLFLLLILLLTGHQYSLRNLLTLRKRAYDGFRYCQLHPLALAIRAISYVSFHLHVLVPPYKKMLLHLLPYLPVIIHTQQGDNFRLQWFYFGNESPTFQWN